MDISLFKDLERLNQIGNFSRAAEFGNLSQPALSRRIKALEAWVGVTLVDRSRQPVKLTAAGSQMLEAGLQALARIEQERSQILDAQSLPDKYVVTFGAQHSIGWRFFPAWLQALEEAYGPILSRLRADDLPGCLRDLKNRDVDFVIAYVAKEKRGADSAQILSFETILIGGDRLIPVCKPNSDGTPLFGFENESIELPWLRFGDSAPIGKLLDPLLEAKNLRKKLKAVYENSMAGALRIRARDGTGVAWLPESLVAPDLAAGILVRTGKADWVVDLEIRLLRNRAHLNRLTRSIWSFLEVRQSVWLLPQAQFS
jgi:DNA-binding transcriptional LysR family regulator